MANVVYAAPTQFDPFDPASSEWWLRIFAAPANRTQVSLSDSEWVVEGTAASGFQGWRVEVVADTSFQPPAVAGGFPIGSVAAIRVSDGTGNLRLTYTTGTSPPQPASALQSSPGVFFDTPMNFDGSGGADLYVGGSGADNLSGGDGNDRLLDRGYGDILPGVGDILHGGAGDDILDGGAGTNKLYGGAGADILVANEGQGELYGEEGNDRFEVYNDNRSYTLVGGPGDDVYDLSRIVYPPPTDIEIIEEPNGGRDRVIVYESDYQLPENVEDLEFHGENRNTGNDLRGNDLDNVITCFESEVMYDYLAGFGGNDILSGDAGGDILDGGAGDDRLDGGGGTDTADYSSATSRVVVNLSLTGPQDTEGSGIDTLVSIEDLSGSGFNDILTGDEHRNYLYGGDRNDILDGGGNNDTLAGGTGTDAASYGSASRGVTVSLAITGAQATGGSGTDTLISIENLYGSSFGDRLTGDGGVNTLRGMAGDDTLDGGAGDDRLDGGAGNDTLIGGDGSDTAAYDETAGSASAGVTVSLAILGPQNTGGAGTDTLSGIENLRGSVFGDVLTGDNLGNALTGLAGNDWMDGGAGTDRLYGGEGADRLFGGADGDRLYGDAGNDTLDGGAGNDILDGGVGRDTASYASAAAAVLVRLALGRQDTRGAGTDTLTSIESATGSAFADTLVGNGSANRLTGGEGDDVLVGGLGDDVLDGSAGTDTARYDYDSASAVAGVTVSLAISGPQDTGGAGMDTLINIEKVRGSLFNDALTGDAGDNALDGRAGDDLLQGGAGADRLYGGDGMDALWGGADADRLYGEAGNDTLHGEDGDDRILGADGADRLYGEAGSDTLIGGVGKDFLNGGDGADLFVFESLADSPGGGSSTTFDQIQDFVAGFDRIDLRSIDANAAAAGDQAFHWIGTAKFTGAAGDLRYTHSGSSTIVQGDVNGDKVADFGVLIAGTLTLNATDFLL